jgi:hypothetical protein
LIRATNVRRGLLRAWIALSVVWSSCWLLAFLEEADRNWPVRFTSGFRSPISRLDFWESRLSWILLPWLLTAAVLCVRWVIRGFR